MKLIKTSLEGILIVKPRIFMDERGSFFESFNINVLNGVLEYGEHFVQDNQSLSKKNVLRGLHYQIKQAQGKLVRVIQGRIFDVAVDLRARSKTFGKWFGIELTDENNTMLFIPKGFAHGFLSLEDNTKVLYKVTDFWSPEYEKTINWRDENLKIQWPLLQAPPLLSDKDLKGVSLQEAELYE